VHNGKAAILAAYVKSAVKRTRAFAAFVYPSIYVWWCAFKLWALLVHSRFQRLL